MARAVARWQAREQEEALRQFDDALARQPEWDNPRWAKPLYSPVVVEVIGEMHAERERRRLKARETR
jgi:hypothetical protein